MKKVCPICKTEYGGGEVFCPVDAARLVTPSQMHAEPEGDDPLVGLAFDKYKVISRIGEGGMGLVYEAEHTVIEKRVAMKILREDFSRRPEVVERFRQEAKSASRIGHENIVDISDFGTTPHGSSYFVMEYLEGEDLANVLAREGTLPTDRIAHVLLQCCRALGAAHDKGIVHRDIKPENIFLVSRGNRRDFVKIVDFGIAKMSDIETEGAPGRKLTKTGMIFGTPEYMSPEQAAGKALDHRVDIYALGVILFEGLTGRVPFVGDSFMGILTQHMFEEAPPLRDVNPRVSTSAEMEMVVYKALAKDPDQRYQTMKELEDAIQDALQGRVSAATMVGYGEPVKARARPPRDAALRPADEFPTGTIPPIPASRRPLMAALAVLLVGLGAAGAWYAAQPDPTPETTPEDPIIEIASPPDRDPDRDVDPVDPVDTTQDPTVAQNPTTPDTVSVTVTTTPYDGAEITVEGDIEGCSPSPCTVELPTGQPAVIHARRDRLVGQIELTPETTTTVQVAIRARRVRMTEMTEMTETMTMTGMGMANDLKTPDVLFR